MTFIATRFGALFAAAFLALGVLGTVHAAEVDGRPGRYEMAAASINAQTDQCYTMYADVVAGNSFISSGTGSVQVTENKNNVVARCQFTDVSGIYETNAEVGYSSDVCSLVTEDGTVYTGGRVQVTAAANNAEDGSDGGNVTIHCFFKK